MHIYVTEESFFATAKHPSPSAAMLSALRRALPIIENQIELAEASGDPSVAEAIGVILSDAKQAIELAIAEGVAGASPRFAIEMNIGGAFERLPEDGFYNTREEAEEEIQDHIAACQAAVAAGDMDDSPAPDDFRVMEVE